MSTKLAIGTKVQVETTWAYGASPDWLGGFKIDSYPENMPNVVKVEKTRGQCAGEKLLVERSKVRADDQKI